MSPKRARSLRLRGATLAACWCTLSLKINHRFATSMHQLGFDGHHERHGLGGTSPRPSVARGWGGGISLTAGTDLPLFKIFSSSWVFHIHPDL